MIACACVRPNVVIVPAHMHRINTVRTMRSGHDTTFRGCFTGRHVIVLCWPLLLNAIVELATHYCTPNMGCRVVVNYCSTLIATVRCFHDLDKQLGMYLSGQYHCAVHYEQVRRDEILCTDKPDACSCNRPASHLRSVQRQSLPLLTDSCYIYV